MYSSPLMLWIVIAGVCGIVGFFVYSKNSVAGFLLGALLGPVGVIVAAVANVSATLEELREDLRKPVRDSSYAPVPAVSLPTPVGGPPARTGKVFCPKCSKSYHANNPMCLHCGAENPLNAVPVPVPSA